MTGFDPVACAGRITDDLAALGRPQRAVSEQAYLKSDLEHFGTSVPDIRSVVKRSLRERPTLSHDELVALVDELWSAPVHERRRHPAAISAWLRADMARMNHVTLREAVKYLPDGDQIVQLWQQRGSHAVRLQPTRRNSVG